MNKTLAALTATIISLSSVTSLHAAEQHGGTPSLPQFDPTWFASQIFWLTVTFTVMYVAFARSIIPAIGQTIESRNDRIQSDMDTARVLKDKAATVKKEYEEIIEHARAEAETMISSAEKTAKKNRDDQIAAFRKHTTQVIKETQRQLAEKKQTALSEMDSAVADIAVKAAQKVGGVSAKPSQAQDIINRIMQEAA